MAHRLAPQAEADLDAIWWHIATQNGSAEIARRQVAAITGRFLVLARHPRIGRARDDDLGPGRRSYPVERYVIVYRLDGENVLILRVVHGSRALEALSYDE
jgi:toxin ParE1/3/4